MPIKSCLYFIYDGKKSTDYNISNVNINSGMLEECFLSSRELYEIEIRNNEKPYFQYIKRKPFILTLSFAFNDMWDSNLIDSVAQWLNVDNYKELEFPEVGLIYNCMPVDDMPIIHNALQQGYINLTMRCDSPYAYSPTYLSPLYDTGIQQISELGTNTTTIKLTNHGLQNNDYIINTTRDEKRKITVVDINTVSVSSVTNQVANDVIFKYPNINSKNIVFENIGSIICHPEISINKIGDGILKITNLSNSGDEFLFSSGTNATGNLTFSGTVSDGETIVVGADGYEFDSDNVKSANKFKVDISSNTIASKNTLVMKINPANGDSITIDTVSYKFKTALDEPYSIKIGAGVTNTIDNLISAINGSTGAGTKYYSTITAHTKVSATLEGTNNIIITAKTPGSLGNTIITTSIFTNYNNRFESTTLLLGQDCSADNAINALISSINTNKTIPITVQKNNNIIIFTYVNPGNVGNVITSSTTRNALWDSSTLTGGNDNLLDDENIYVNCERQEIISDISNTYRISIFNDNYIGFPKGVNNLVIEGNCKIQFRYKFKILQR